MNELRRRAAVKKSELDRLRPLSADSLAALSEWYDVELTYTSNAIEGNTLTRSETAVILEKGITIGGKHLKEHLEVIGHKDALDYVRALAERGEPVREVDIRSIHRLIMERIEPSEAGRYSTHQRTIRGSTFVLPSPFEIPALMGDFGQWLGHAPAGPDSAFEAHATLVTIHPFSDGNGRTARLLMNLLLLKSGYPPVIIGPEHRIEYLDTLQLLQTAHDPEPHLAFLFDRLEESLERHLSHVKRGAARPSAPPGSTGMS